MWLPVRQRFRQFYSELNPTPGEVEDALCKAFRVGRALKRAYCGQATDNPPVFQVVSWGKETRFVPLRTSTSLRGSTGASSSASPMRQRAVVSLVSASTSGGKTTATAIELASPPRNNMASTTERDDARRDIVSG